MVSELSGARDVPLPPAAASFLTYQTISAIVKVTVPLTLAAVPCAGVSVTVYVKLPVVAPGAGV